MRTVKFDDSEKGLESWYEWKKNRSAEGVIFDSSRNLTLTGITEETKVYQKLNIMVGWINDELDLCGEVLKNTSRPYRDTKLPGRVKNNVEPKGFEVGSYEYEIDKNDAIKLFMSENMYMDKMVFVRELLQNAIDASIYYKKIKEIKLEKMGYIGGKCDVNPVSVHVWKDEEDNMFFLIKDNGMGMDREAISKYFLKIGKSFYDSDTFKHSGIDFTPISRFGIGFLSAFFATNEIVVVTKHYKNPNILLQLTINKDTDEYILRENDMSTYKANINQSIIDWNGNSVKWSDVYDDDEKFGTLIYFQIKEESIYDNINLFKDAINKYLLIAPVGVECNINGLKVNHDKLKEQFMAQISLELDKIEICTGLHKNVNSFDEDEEIFFESLPLLFKHTDENGCINGRLQILVVYDTKRKNDTYDFSYDLDYAKDTLALRFGGYQKKINNAGLNQEYQLLGLEDKVKVYFNGINHLLMNDTDLGARSSGFLSGYLMLEGRYRPEVDIARSGKGYLDLDAMAHINYLYFEEIQKYVKNDIHKRNAFFSLKHPEILLNVNKTLYLDYEIYNKMICPFDWSKISIIRTEKGYLSVEEIKVIFTTGGISEIELFDEITLNRLADFKGLLVRYLLKNNFNICVKIKDNIEQIFIRSIAEDQEDYSLPPLFFIEYENMEILKYGNYPLNKRHWFSEWLIGIAKKEEFRENKSNVIQHLQWDLVNNPIKRDELIKDINKILNKYEQRLLINRDIITFRSEELDLRDWLQMLER